MRQKQLFSPSFRRERERLARSGSAASGLTIAVRLAIMAGLLLLAATTFTRAQTAPGPALAAPPVATPEATATATAAPTTAGSGMKNLLGVDLIDLVRKADYVGKACLCILALFSISSLTIIVYKWLHIRQACKQTEGFIELCNQGNGELEDAFRISASFPDSPLALILREAYMDLEMENWYQGEGYDTMPEARVEIAKISMERIFERTITSEIAHLESKLIFLATTSSVCPFIGLFGTVWGIMGAFQSLASSGGTLANLGPGLSTAMLTIIGGLICAIPATAMFNYLTNKVRSLGSQMDSFSLELGNIIQKQIIKQSTGTIPAGGLGRPL